MAFAFTVMADPVSSVAYAIEAALDGMDHELRSLLPTMALVVAIIALVAASYQQLIARFPNGGGGAEGLAAAFGEGWAFLPLGALLVDFTLTIAVSCAAGGAALVAYFPGLDSHRTAMALGLALAVAFVVSTGHRGRVVLATATLGFLAAAAFVIVRAAGAEAGSAPAPLVGDAALAPVLLAMPLGMALATGIEAPSNAIAQLGQLDEAGRRRFGRLTMWLMVVIVGALTLAFATLAVRLGVARPPGDSTLLADVARASVGDGAAFAVFQGFSALLLLAAAASSYLAGSGLLEALAVHGGEGRGLVLPAFGRVNRFYVPQWGVGLLFGIAAVLVVLAGGHEQTLVRFYAVAVFASFLGALVACAALSRREGRTGALAINVAGALAVALVLGLNVRRGYPALALLAAAALSLYLWRVWVARGRPGGVPGVAG